MSSEDSELAVGRRPRKLPRILVSERVLCLQASPMGGVVILQLERQLEL